MPWGDWNAFDALIDEITDLTPGTDYNILVKSYSNLFK